MHTAPPLYLWLRLEEALLSRLIAMGAEAMRRLAVRHVWLKAVSDRAGSKSLHLVALFFTFPVFQLHDLLFKFTYALGRRRLGLICRRQRLLGSNYVLLERDLDFIDHRLSVGSIEALCDVKGRLEAAKARADFR